MNPYHVLGINETATQEEIRTAYRSLVKKYHPDQFTDPRQKRVADEKLKEINQAYDMITKGEYKRNTYWGGGFGGATRQYPPGNGSYSGEHQDELAQARAFLSQHNEAAARAILDRMQVHNAEWHYLYGIIYLRSGWNDMAREHMRRAYEMDPGNMEYRDAYETLLRSRRTYAGPAGNVTPCDICQCLLCTDCCCECLGGDCLRC